jgi:hypothetical protein
MKIAFWFGLMGLLLVLSGCAASGNSPDNNKDSGVYGGMTGGGSRP